MLNAYQQQMFDDLEWLADNTEAFYKQDFVVDGVTYRIYNYRLSSYSDFLRPNALNARGTMFRTQPDVELVSLPMSKFFNINENPFTMGLDLTQVDVIQTKADGSLISTYMHNGQLRLKSKGSVSSDQATAAMKWLNQNVLEQNFLRDYLTAVTAAGVTVNLEWTAPDNRIVLGYLEPRLTILNCRRMSDGEYVHPWHPVRGLDYTVEEVGQFLVEEHKPVDPVAFIESIPNMTEDIEGFVVKMTSGLWFKSKTLKYLSLHHAKDSVTNPRRLYEAVLDEGVDDLLSMFSTDALAVQIIREMQERVTRLHNHIATVVDNFHAANKDLDRKGYAIKGQAELDRLYFGLAMSKYLGTEVNYRTFMKSKWKELGFKDTTTDATE